MKSTLLLSAATLLCAAAQAQTTDSTTQTTTGTTGSTMDSTRKLNAYGSYSTRDSIAAKYKQLPMPGALTIEKAFPILGTYQLNTSSADGSTGLTGTAGTTSNTTTGTDSNSTTTDATGSTTTGVTPSTMTGPAVTVTMDSASKGIVWVDGLQQGRLKAYLRKSPATYRIVAQKSGTGTSIPEGTMMLDQATNTLHIALGAPYNDVDPTAVFSLSNGTANADNTAEVKVKTKNTKTKSKLTFITATKVDATQQQGQMQQGQVQDSTQNGQQLNQQQ